MNDICNKLRTLSYNEDLDLKTYHGYKPFCILGGRLGLEY